MYTAYAHYYATGEGMTRMVMFTRGYGVCLDKKENVRKSFADKFGGYYAMGVDIYEGINLDLEGIDLLLSEKMKSALADWQKDAGGLEYHASIHVNFA